MTDKEELLKKYPFLKDENGKIRFVNEIPKGWWKRFGIAFLDDLKDVLKRNNVVNSFIIYDAREKYGCLTFDTGGHPDEWLEHLDAWEYISEKTCVDCGAFPVSMRNINSWLEPLCAECMTCRIDRIGKNDHPKSFESYIDEEADQDIKIKNAYDPNRYKRERDPSLKKIEYDMIPYYKKINYEYK